MENNWIKHKPAILPYKGKYVDNWFSNMKPSEFIAGDYKFPTVEHFYQAMKTANPLESILIMKAETPYEAKRMGRKVDKPFEYLIGEVNVFTNEIVSTQEEAKLMMMEVGLLYKFQLPEWGEKLLATGDSILVEWNNWGDHYFGADVETGKGENHLGRLLMEIRKKIKK